jgi:hypothetical protein
MYRQHQRRMENKKRYIYANSNAHIFISRLKGTCAGQFSISSLLLAIGPLEHKKNPLDINIAYNAPNRP